MWIGIGITKIISVIICIYKSILTENDLYRKREKTVKNACYKLGKKFTKSQNAKKRKKLHDFFYFFFYKKSVIWKKL